MDFVVRDDLAASREEFINHLLKENLEREDFDVIERARGVEQLVTVCAEAGERGARSRAAEQLGKDRSWVTNQLVLLELPEELQAMLSAGSLPERDGRTLARYAKENPELEAAALLDHLKAAKEAAAVAKAQERLRLQALRDAEDRGLLSADNEGSREAEAPQTAAALLSADNKSIDNPRRDAARPPAQRQPPQAPDNASNAATSAEGVANTAVQGRGDQPRTLPYDDPFYVVQHLHTQMATADFLEGARAWMALLREQHPEEYRSLLREFGQQEQQSA
uniref:Putative plasmid partitioning protein n=1 Tax=Streptomyces violaceoruber TaxID=1935 RepID=Q849K7_STRVN|nr:plasmid partitioning protein [Streptomyces violaceoruber]AAO50117.1 putative plasmid partitioning protein [Streptomyces violaceoruber]